MKKTLIITGILPGSSVALLYKGRRTPLEVVKAGKSNGGDFVVDLPFRFRSIFRRRPFILRVRRAGHLPQEYQIRRKSGTICVGACIDVLYSEKPSPYLTVTPRSLA